MTFLASRSWPNHEHFCEPVILCEIGASYLELNISTSLNDIDSVNFFESKETFGVLHAVWHGNCFPVEVLNSDGALIVAAVSLDGFRALVCFRRLGFGIASSFLAHGELNSEYYRMYKLTSVSSSSRFAKKKSGRKFRPPWNLIFSFPTFNRNFNPLRRPIETLPRPTCFCNG